MRTTSSVLLALALALGVPRLASADPPTTRPLGVRYRLERIEVVGNRHTRREVIVDRLSFEKGQVFDVDDPEIEKARLSLLATGYFSEAELSLRRGRQRGWVVLVVRVRERSTIQVLDISTGLAQGDLYGGLDIGDANFLGLGINTSAGLVLGAGQQAYRLRFLDPDLFGQRSYLQITGLYNHARDFVATQDILATDCPPEREYRCATSDVAYDRGGLTIGLGRGVGASLRLSLRYRVELIRVSHMAEAASRTRGDEIVPVDFDIHRGTSVLSTLSTGVEFDSRDDPFLPSRGVRLWTEAEVGSRVTGSSYEYARFTAGLEAYTRFRWGHVLKLELFGGLVVGDAPFFEQFFVGDLSDLAPSRVLDLSFDDRPAPNLLGTDIAEMRYEDVAAKVGLEYAVPLYRGRGIVYRIDFFGGMGLYALASGRDLILPPTGYDGLSKAPVDLTFDLGFRVDTEVGVFGLSFSNLIGLIPFRREDP